MVQELIRHTRLLEIVGDMVKVRAAGVSLGDLAVVENTDGQSSSARVIEVEEDVASLQVFSGGKGRSNPLGMTQIVVPPASTAPVWATVSAPVANPDTTAMPSLSHSW